MDINDDSDVSESDEENVYKAIFYPGQKDENGDPHGRGTLTFSSGDRFEGKFIHGLKNGKGSFIFQDGSSLAGFFKDDALNGKGIYSYEDGSIMVGEYIDGELNGEAKEYDSSGRLTFKGCHTHNIRSGLCHFWDEFDGQFFGVVDSDGVLSGDEITYVYPDGETALKGTFKESELVEAKLAQRDLKSQKEYVFVLCSPSISFKRDVSTMEKLSENPLLQDPYEVKRSYVSKSQIQGAGEGLFAKISVDEGEVMSFYNGIRLTHQEVDARDWKYNSNTISLDDKFVIDVPEEMSDLHVYCASLGHKANHSFTPNSKYDRFDHPRFGKIKCIRTIKAVREGEELTVAYGYDHNGLGENEADAPDWYRTQLEIKKHGGNG